MGIFDRLSTMLRSNINDLISRAENPEKMLNQLIDDMRGNLAKAKQEMAQSKYPHGFSVQMLMGSGNASERTTAQIVQAELAPLGIKVMYYQDPEGNAIEIAQKVAG
jgi:ABC-type transport system substrate-binding protein